MRTFRYILLAAVIPLMLASCAKHVGHVGPAAAYADPDKTPGVVDDTLSVDVICSQSTKVRRHVSVSEKKEAMARYGLSWSDHKLYEFDHDQPLELGGKNVIENLWPQLWEWAHKKDVVENYLHRKVCRIHTEAALKEAQEQIRTDWYKVYLEIHNGGEPEDDNTGED